MNITHAELLSLKKKVSRLLDTVSDKESLDIVLEIDSELREHLKEASFDDDQFERYSFLLYPDGPKKVTVSVSRTGVATKDIELNQTHA